VIFRSFLTDVVITDIGAIMSAQYAAGATISVIFSVIFCVISRHFPVVWLMLVRMPSGRRVDLLGAYQ